ncbi:thiol-disulfide oxidoreductase DCC family protein [uncultured Gimesia sp.]|uniref:thiol-disulfide oxidoreductase DCC family protein n=1 Tax=uncultured Gimesia sp. TaxID=1678688 RepID=UPI0026362D9A|nr:DUF393 domain-containing protein [uncultured Gimesia sp.]
MNQQYELEAFYDAACPLCEKEVRMIRLLDRKSKILFTNIADPDFSAEKYGKTYGQFMNEMHARLSDDTWVTGVEVFRRLYSIVGLGWLVAVTRLPGLSQLIELFYRVFAQNRLRFTGRCHQNDSSCDITRTTSEVQL